MMDEQHAQTIPSDRPTSPPKPPLRQRRDILIG